MRSMQVKMMCLLVVISCLAGCKEKEAPPEVIPVVNGQVLELEDVTLSMEFSGFIEASSTVQILPRVTGYIEGRNFKEGEYVEENQILFEIEKDVYEATKQSAEASLKIAEATLTQTKNDYDRAQKLLKNGDIPKSTFDQQKAAYEGAAGAVQQAKASLRTAELDLGYATIRAPVAGKISDTIYERGNYITPAVGALTQIVVTNPVRVNFGVSNGLINEFQDAPKKSISDVKNMIRAKLRFENGRFYEKEGAVTFIDVLVDRITDSLKMRVEFENEDNVLIPGQYVNIVLESKEAKKGIVIPRSAMLTDKQGSYVLLEKNGVVAVTRITPGQETTSTVYVKEGLSAGDILIIDGLQKVRPEGKVTVVTAKQPGEKTGSDAK